MNSLLEPTPQGKRKFPWADARAVAAEICRELKPHCVPERLIVAGSLRRRKPMVGDVEVLYIPKMVPGIRTDMFAAPALADCVEARLEYLIEARRTIARRPNRLGNETWGDKNKLSVHLASGIPVDFFATTAPNWFNYLVCRTGPAELNIRISEAAQAKGWKWHPYKSGFTDREGNVIPVTSEREVFEFVNLKYLEPWER